MGWDWHPTHGDPMGPTRLPVAGLWCHHSWFSFGSDPSWCLCLDKASLAWVLVPVEAGADEEVLD